MLYKVMARPVTFSQGFTSWKWAHVKNRAEPAIFQANLSSRCLKSSQNHSEPNQESGITHSLERWSSCKVWTPCGRGGQPVEKTGSNTVLTMDHGSVFRNARHSRAETGSPAWANSLSLNLSYSSDQEWVLRHHLPSLCLILFKAAIDEYWPSRLRTRQSSGALCMTSFLCLHQGEVWACFLRGCGPKNSNEFLSLKLGVEIDLFL